MVIKTIAKFFALPLFSISLSFIFSSQSLADDYCDSGIDITIKNSDDSPAQNYPAHFYLDETGSNDCSRGCPAGVNELSFSPLNSDAGGKILRNLIVTVNCGLGACPPRRLWLVYEDPLGSGDWWGVILPEDACSAIVTLSSSPSAPGICSAGSVDTWVRLGSGCLTCASTATTGESISGNRYSLCCCQPPDLINSHAVNTEFGLIATETQYLIEDVMTLVLGLVGGIAFLLLLLGSLRYITAGGNPDAVSYAKSIITAALTGLAVVIFSVLILAMMGVNIINIPGWSFIGGQLQTPN